MALNIAIYRYTVCLPNTTPPPLHTQMPLAHRGLNQPVSTAQTSQSPVSRVGVWQKLAFWGYTGIRVLLPQTNTLGLAFYCTFANTWKLPGAFYSSCSYLVGQNIFDIHTNYVWNYISVTRNKGSPKYTRPWPLFITFIFAQTHWSHTDLTFKVM